MENIRDILGAALAGLQPCPEKEKRGRLLEMWPSIAGPQLVGHTKPSLLESGALCVWVDQPSLAYELSQRYRQTLLKRVQAALGEEAVHSIFFRVGEIRKQ